MVDIRCLFTHTLLILQVKNLAGERLFLHKLPDSLNYAFDRVVDHFFPGFDHDVRFGIIGVFFPDIFFQLVFQMFVVAFDKRAVAPAGGAVIKNVNVGFEPDGDGVLPRQFTGLGGHERAPPEASTQGSP